VNRYLITLLQYCNKWAQNVLGKGEAKTERIDVRVKWIGLFESKGITVSTSSEPNS